jgi:hypothetical protein
MHGGWPGMRDYRPGMHEYRPRMDARGPGMDAGRRLSAVPAVSLLAAARERSTGTGQQNETEQEHRPAHHRSVFAKKSHDPV